MKRKRIAKDSILRKLMLSLYYLGLVLGSIYFTKYESASVSGYFTNYIDTYLHRHSSGNFLIVFSYAFLAVLGINLLVLICSLSCFGSPFLLFLSLLRGISGGVLTAALYLQYGGKGILFFVLLLWIPQILISFALLQFSLSALDISLQMFLYAVHRKNGAFLIDSGSLVQEFVLFSSVGLAAALLEGVLSMILGPIFIM